MATVVKRMFISSPQRDAHETWTAIRDILTHSATGDAQAEFDSVAGVAASIIAERTPADAPIVVTSNGPRTRIYCLYDEDAIDGSDANEDVFGFDPLNGDWKVSLPCPTDDLGWVQSALSQLSTRFTAREPEEAVTNDDSTANEVSGLTLNTEKFLSS